MDDRVDRWTYFLLDVPREQADNTMCLSVCYRVARLWTTADNTMCLSVCYRVARLWTTVWTDGHIFYWTFLSSTIMDDRVDRWTYFLLDVPREQADNTTCLSVCYRVARLWTTADNTMCLSVCYRVARLWTTVWTDGHIFYWTFLSSTIMDDRVDRWTYFLLDVPREQADNTMCLSVCYRVARLWTTVWTDGHIFYWTFLSSTIMDDRVDRWTYFLLDVPREQADNTMCLSVRYRVARLSTTMWTDGHIFYWTFRSSTIMDDRVDRWIYFLLDVPREQADNTMCLSVCYRVARLWTTADNTMCLSVCYRVARLWTTVWTDGHIFYFMFLSSTIMDDRVDRWTYFLLDVPREQADNTMCLSVCYRVADYGRPCGPMDIFFIGRSS
ncbi:hypothetical protein J6590_029519 [Homalodisca vitripennis]|nr:hypothetical protein J6590_029519 [Homalodisca vitripennis]